MRKLLALGVFALAGRAEAQVVTEMTPARIQEAIADKKADGCYDLKKDSRASPRSPRVAFCAGGEEEVRAVHRAAGHAGDGRARGGGLPCLSPATSWAAVAWASRLAEADRGDAGDRKDPPR
jgi:hypothetical protein